MSTDPSPIAPVPPVPPVSPVYDELHDDYTAALAALGPPTGEPADLVARGTLATLAGDSAEALRLLRAAADTAAPGSRELLRALAWTRLARTCGYGLWPDGCGVLTPQMEALRPGIAAAAKDERRFREAYLAARDAGVIDLDLDLETLVVRQVLATLPVALSTLRAAAGTGNAGQRLPPLAEDLRALRESLEGIPACDPLTALLSRAMAALHREAGDDDGAFDLLVDAQERSYRAGDAHGVAAVLIMSGDWAAAVRTSPLLLDLRPTAGLDLDTDRTAEGILAGREVLPEAAEEAYQEAERVLRAAGGEPAPRVRAALALRRSHLRRLADDEAGDRGGDTAAGPARGEEAVRLAAEAETIAAAVGDQRLRWTARVHRDLAEIAAGRPVDADATARELAGWALGPGSVSLAEGLGALCSQAGHLAASTGRYERAVACHRLARRVHRALGFTLGEARCAADLGVLRARIGDLPAARVALEEAADLFEAEARGGGPLAARADNRLLGVLVLHLHQLDVERADPDAMERTAARIRAAASRLPEVDDATGVMAARRLERGSRLLTESLMTERAERTERTGKAERTEEPLSADQDGPFMAWLLRRTAQEVLERSEVQVPALRGRAERALGRTAEAEAFFEAAEAAAAASGESRRDLHLALVRGERGRWEEAAASYAAFLERGGHVVGAVGTPAAAGAGDETGIEAPEKRARDHAAEAGVLVSLRAYALAEDRLRRVREVLGDRWWTRAAEPWAALETEAATAFGLGRVEEAAGLYREAVAWLEGLRGELRDDGARLSMAGSPTVSRVHFGLARCLLRAREEALGARDGDRALRLGEEAFLAAERCRARAFLDLLGSRRADGAGDVPALAAWRAASAEVTLLRQTAADRLARTGGTGGTDGTGGAGGTGGTGAGPWPGLREAEARLGRVEEDLARERPALWRSLDLTATPPDPRRVAALLPPGAVLLAYQLRGTDLLAWAVGGDGLREAVRSPADDVAGLVRTLHSAYGSGKRVPGAEEELARLLLGPLDGAVRESESVVVVPSGVLHTVPFAALPWDGAPLGARRTLSVLPSAGTLGFLRPPRDAGTPPGADTPRGRGGVLAVGDPEGMRFPPAPGLPAGAAPGLAASVLEACAAAARPDGRPGARARVLLGEAATAEGVRRAMPGASIVHLATHAQLDESVPLASAVLLAHGEALTVAELPGIALDADVVILSACRTAGGGGAPGDDVQGLLRGVLASGARAAVVTLWPVGDMAAALLMTEFHERFDRSGSVPGALREAQEAFRLRDRAGQLAAYGRMVARAERAAAELGDETLADHVAGARHLLDDEHGKAWDWADDGGHPRHWAAFVAVAAP